MIKEDFRNAINELINEEGKITVTAIRIKLKYRTRYLLNKKTKEETGLTAVKLRDMILCEVIAAGIQRGENEAIIAAMLGFSPDAVNRIYKRTKGGESISEAKRRYAETKDGGFLDVYEGGMFFKILYRLIRDFQYMAAVALALMLLPSIWARRVGMLLMIATVSLATILGSVINCYTLIYCAFKDLEYEKQYKLSWVFIHKMTAMVVIELVMCGHIIIFLQK